MLGENILILHLAISKQNYIKLIKANASKLLGILHPGSGINSPSSDNCNLYIRLAYCIIWFDLAEEALMNKAFW